MSSGTSTERSERPSEPGLQPWQLFLLLSMGAATVAVIAVGRGTQPIALVLLSATIIAAGLVGLALHGALAGFFGRADERAPLGDRAAEALEREKALVLRSIKELEFDRAMGKIGAEDFANISGRLRGRAAALMQELDRKASPPVNPAAPKAAAPGRCRECGTRNDRDATFCKRCGARL